MFVGIYFLSLRYFAPIMLTATPTASFRVPVSVIGVGSPSPATFLAAKDNSTAPAVTRLRRKVR